jgi:hypothetical protein
MASRTVTRRTGKKVVVRRKKKKSTVAPTRRASASAAPKRKKTTVTTRSVAVEAKELANRLLQPPPLKLRSKIMKYIDAHYATIMLHRDRSRPELFRSWNDIADRVNKVTRTQVAYGPRGLQLRNGEALRRLVQRYEESLALRSGSEPGTPVSRPKRATATKATTRR